MVLPSNESERKESHSLGRKKINYFKWKDPEKRPGFLVLLIYYYSFLLSFKTPAGSAQSYEWSTQHQGFFPPFFSFFVSPITCVLPPNCSQNIENLLALDSLFVELLCARCLNKNCLVPHSSGGWPFLLICSQLNEACDSELLKSCWDIWEKQKDKMRQQGKESNIDPSFINANSCFICQPN